MKFRIKFLFFFCILIRSVSGQTLDELLKQGDNYLDSMFVLEKAIETYNKADELYPDNYEVAWRLSRINVYSAEKMPVETGEQKDKQLAAFQKAMEYANKTIKLAPDKSNGYIRRAIANGKIALFKGVFSVGSVVNSVKEDCEKAVKLGNGGNFIQALAHYIIARTNAKVSEKWAPARAVLGLGWADIDTAIVEYQTAVKLYPGFRMFHLDLARAYIEEDEYTKAEKALKKAIACPKKDLNDDIILAEARELLNKVKDE